MSSRSEYNREYHRKHGVRLRAKARERMSRYRSDPEYRARVDARVKEYRRTPKGKARWYDYHLRRKYGITLVDYERMVAEQLSACRICGSTERKLVVDHCHVTGKVRGVICQYCNGRLGWYERYHKQIQEYISGPIR